MCACDYALAYTHALSVHTHAQAMQQLTYCYLSLDQNGEKFIVRKIKNFENIVALKMF